MKSSCDRFLPESWADFNQLDLDGLYLKFRHCVKCKEPFTDSTCRTKSDWAETQISGFCGNCWNDIFSSSGGNSTL